MNSIYVRSALLITVCFALYSNSLQGAFHYDDFHSLVDNPHVRKWENIPQFFVDKSLFSADAEKSMYRPLLLVSYALNYAVTGYGEMGFHLVNISLHALASVLVAAIAAQLLTGNAAPWVAGLFFALHPLATEPVNYISSRSESLAACFYLLVIWLHLARSKGNRGNLFWASGWAAYAAALLSKSVALSAPIALGLLDHWQKRRSSWAFYMPYVALAIVYVAVLYQIRFIGNSLAEPVRAWDVQLWTQLKAPAYYVFTFFMPVKLNVQHQFIESTSPWTVVVWCGMAFSASLIFLIWRARNIAPGWALIWSILVLLPTFIMPLNMLVNERRLYMPLAAMAWIVAHYWRGGPRWMWVSFLLIMSSLVWQRNEIWHADLNLWKDAEKKAPMVHAVQNNLGKALQRQGFEHEALLAYERAIALDSRHGDAYNNAATIYHMRGKKMAEVGDDKQATFFYQRAVEGYGQALQRYPNYEEIHQNLADAQVGLGELAAAIKSYKNALEIAPDKADIWSNYGQALYLAKYIDEAEKAFLNAIDRTPDHPEPYNNLGNIYADKGQFERAIAHYRKALALEVEAPELVWLNLIAAYRQAGEFDEARGEVQNRLLEDGGNAAWHFELGRIERGALRPEQAKRAFARAVQLDARHERALVQWGEILIDENKYAESVVKLAAAVAIRENYARAWYGLGFAYRAMENTIGAQYALRRFLDVWPESEDDRSNTVRGWIRELEAGRE